MPWKLEIWLPKQFIPLSTQMPLARGFRKFKSPENGLHPCQSPFQLPAIQKKAWLPCRLWGASTGGLGGPPLVSLACGRPFLPTSSSSRSRARPASRYRASRHRGANFSLCGRGGRKPPSGCFSPQTRFRAPGLERPGCLRRRPGLVLQEERARGLHGPGMAPALAPPLAPALAPAGWTQGERGPRGESRTSCGPSGRSCPTQETQPRAQSGRYGGGRAGPGPPDSAVKCLPGRLWGGRGGAGGDRLRPICLGEGCSQRRRGAPLTQGSEVGPGALGKRGRKGLYGSAPGFIRLVLQVSLLPGDPQRALGTNPGRELLPCIPRHLPVPGDRGPPSRGAGVGDERAVPDSPREGPGSARGPRGRHPGLCPCPPAPPSVPPPRRAAPPRSGPRSRSTLPPEDILSS